MAVLTGPTELELIGRVALAAACGAAIGFERELYEKPVGLRTHALVALGAAAFTEAGFAGIPYAVGGGSSIDVTRVAAQVVTGIGFLGAGIVIFNGDRLRGLTTAAETWAVAALGVLCGLGSVLLALFITALILIIVVGGRPVETLVQKLRTRRERHLLGRARGRRKQQLESDEAEVASGLRRLD